MSPNARIPTQAEQAPRDAVDRAVRRERETLLEHVHSTVDSVLVAFSIAWVALLVVELAGGGLPPILDAAVWMIWATFIVDFVIELAIAPDRVAYLKANWLTALSLSLPAVRIIRVLAPLRVLRAARVVRTVGLLRILTSVNRGLGSLRRTASRRGLGYVLAATVLVMFTGAGGMAYFETPAGRGGIGSYADALWWTAYAMTTGATSQPASTEGRLLGWLLSLFGLGVFGYLTATLASHFIGRERETS